MEKLIELGLEKKGPSKKLDQNEDDGNDNDEGGNGSQMKEAKSFNRSLKIMERMIIKNKDSQIYQ